MAKIKLTQDFKEFLSLLNSEKTEYLLVGGYAVGLYGVERHTKDMDVWISTAPENLDRLIDVLGKFGFRRDQFKRESFTGPKSIFRMGVPPNMLEITTRIAGVDFAGCYERRNMMEIEGMSVPVIDLQDLIKNKTAAGRDQDRADVAKLQKRPPSV
jgi:predicted nucleotidyltransferase